MTEREKERKMNREGVWWSKKAVLLVLTIGVASLMCMAALGACAPQKASVPDESESAAEVSAAEDEDAAVDAADEQQA